MEVGVFQGASVGPRPWDQSEPERIRRDIEIGVAADEAGFDYFWAPEHHSLEEYSHNSSSHLSCLTVGLKTQNIRLVTGIFNLCPAINHPVRVAEQIAYIDIVTDGRIELGTGRGSGSTEVNTFGVDANETRGMWEEAIREIPKMWTQDLYAFEGKHFSVPERCILPKPISKPHPPLWVTASNPSTVEAAAKMGIGVALFSFSSPELLRPLVEIYKETIETKRCEDGRQLIRRSGAGGCKHMRQGTAAEAPTEAEQVRFAPIPRLPALAEAGARSAAPSAQCCATMVANPSSSNMSCSRWSKDANAPGGMSATSAADGATTYPPKNAEANP